MRKYILTVTLNPAIDKLVRIPCFKIGADFRASEVYLSAGGKGLNVSRVLTSFSLNSIATGMIGGASGNYIKNQLTTEGIRNNFFKISGETRTSLTIVDSQTEKTTRVLEQGPIVKPLEFKSFKRKLFSLLKYCDCVIFSGYIAAGLPDSTYADLIKVVQERNIKAFLDTSGRPLFMGVQSKPFLIKPNREEAEMVLGQKVSSILQIKKAIQRFLNYGIKVVLISLGRQGLVGSQGREIWLITPPKIKCKNPVGCGDASIGGFVYGRYKGQRFLECLKAAVAAGTANAVSLQPGKVNFHQFQRLLTEIKIRCI